MERMKRAALINDISGLGKCSLVADISVITAMGVEACPFPTAVLNAQTGFEGYECTDLTGSMRGFADGWKNMGVRFDGILTGFFLNAEQAEEAIRFADGSRTSETLLLVDPVMADEGVHYANFDQKLLEKMKDLADRADIVTPNISELCLLAGKEALAHVLSERDLKELCAHPDPALLETLAKELIRGSEKTVVVTGIPLEEETGGKLVDNVFDKPAENLTENQNGNLTDDLGADSANERTVKMIGNLIVRKDGSEMITFPSEGGSFSGTGDLFAAALLGGLLNGKSIAEAVRTAGFFIGSAVRDASRRNIPGKYGTDYEKYLHLLTEQRELTEERK